MHKEEQVKEVGAIDLNDLEKALPVDPAFTAQSPLPVSEPAPALDPVLKRELDLKLEVEGEAKEKEKEKYEAVNDVPPVAKDKENIGS